MEMALGLAAKGRGHTAPNPMVGAVIVKGEQVVGRGFHARAGQAHAEAIALREAGKRAKGSTLYVTLEPCSHHGKTPPCTDAIIEAGITRVVAAMEDPNPLVKGKGFKTLLAADIDVEVGCMQPQARLLNEFFVVYHELQRPFVTLKWAMTACGRTSHDSGESRWISNSGSRQYGHRLRAAHDGVMVGVGTVLSDDPMLNVRVPDHQGSQPKKIVLDGALSIPTRARLLRERGGAEVLLFTTPFADQKVVEQLRNEGRKVIILPSRRRLLDVELVMKELYKEGIMSVLVEGGRRVHTALLAKGMADKVVAFMAPKVLGGGQLRSPVEDLKLERLSDAFHLRDVKWQAFDDDLCLEGYLREI